MSNAGAANTNPPTPPTFANLDAWIKAYGAATAAGIDPQRRTTPYYVRYDETKKGWVGAVPHNMILDAKTLKVLEKGVPYTQIESTIQKYLQ